MAAANALMDHALEGLGLDDSEFHEALSNPDLLRELGRNPGSKLAGAASRLVTGRALQMAWAGLLPSYGLTLLYINFHYFARHFAYRKGFTPLGSEWKVWRMVLGWPGFGLKYAEVIVLFFLDMLALLVVLAAATLIGMVAYAITSPCEFVGKVGYATAVIIAALGGAAAQAGVAACVVINAASG